MQNPRDRSRNTSTELEFTIAFGVAERKNLKVLKKVDSRTQKTLKMRRTRYPGVGGVNTSHQGLHGPTN